MTPVMAETWQLSWWKHMTTVIMERWQVSKGKHDNCQNGELTRVIVETCQTVMIYIWRLLADIQELLWSTANKCHRRCIVTVMTHDNCQNRYMITVIMEKEHNCYGRQVTTVIADLKRTVMVDAWYPHDNCHYNHMSTMMTATCQLSWHPHDSHMTTVMTDLLQTVITETWQLPWQLPWQLHDNCHKSHMTIVMSSTF